MFGELSTKLLLVSFKALSIAFALHLKMVSVLAPRRDSIFVVYFLISVRFLRDWLRGEEVCFFLGQRALTAKN